MKREQKMEKLEKGPEGPEEQKIEEKSQYRRSVAESRSGTDRDIRDYENDLGIPITKKFLGETVLDLGSGDKETFVKQAVERGINVHPLSLALSKQCSRNLLKESWEQYEKLGKKIEKRSVAGLAQELPYKSNVFDSVLSMWAIPFHLPETEEEYEVAFREIVRVLKPGGKAFLAPIKFCVNREFLKKAIKKIEEDGVAKFKQRKSRNRTLVLIKPKRKNNS